MITFYKKYLFFIFVFFFTIACNSLQEADKLYDRAIQLWEQNEYEESIQHFITLTKSYPSSYLVDDSLYFIANIYHVHLKEKKQAIRYYRYLNKQYSNSEYYYFSLLNLAQLHASSKNDIDKAIRIYQTLQEEFSDSPDWSANQIELAKLLLLKKKLFLARAELKKLIQNESQKENQSLAYFLIGFSYYQEGKIQLAELAYETSQKLSENTLEKWYAIISLASLYEEKGQLKTSVSIFENLSKQLPQDELLGIVIQKRIKKIQVRLSKI